MGEVRRVTAKRKVLGLETQSSAKVTAIGPGQFPLFFLLLSPPRIGANT